MLFDMTEQTTVSEEEGGGGREDEDKGVLGAVFVRQELAEDI